MAAHNILHPLKNGYYLQIYRQINIFLPVQYDKTYWEEELNKKSIVWACNTKSNPKSVPDWE